MNDVGSVSHYEFRVRSRVLKAEFEETFDDLKVKFEKVTQIEDFLQHNASIKQLARSLLSIGDFLNYVRISSCPIPLVHRGVIVAGFVCR